MRTCFLWVYFLFLLWFDFLHPCCRSAYTLTSLTLYLSLDVVIQSNTKQRIGQFCRSRILFVYTVWKALCVWVCVWLGESDCLSCACSVFAPIFNCSMTLKTSPRPDYRHAALTMEDLKWSLNSVCLCSHPISSLSPVNRLHFRSYSADMDWPQPRSYSFLYWFFRTAALHAFMLFCITIINSSAVNCA